MRIVWRPGSWVEGQLGKQILLDAGINCFFQGEHLAGGIGDLPAFSLYALLVEPEQLGAAEQVLRESGLLHGEDSIDA